MENVRTLSWQRKILLEVLSIPVVIMGVLVVATAVGATERTEVLSEVIPMSRTVFLLGNPVFSIVGIFFVIQTKNRQRGLAYLLLGLASFAYATGFASTHYFSSF
jgi:hypothetical protein